MTVNDTENWAIAQDNADPLVGFRDRFHIPKEDGREQIYFCGNGQMITDGIAIMEAKGLGKRTRRIVFEKYFD